MYFPIARLLDPSFSFRAPIAVYIISSYGGWLGVEIGSGGGRWLLGWTVKGTVAGVGGGGSEGGSMEGESEREDWEKEK